MLMESVSTAHRADAPFASRVNAPNVVGITKQSVIEAYRKRAIKGYKMGAGLRAPLVLYRDTGEAYAKQRREQLARRNRQQQPG